MGTYRIVIADDSSHAREGVRDILESTGEFSIVGEARNGREVIELTESLMPDLILMDINMPVMDGLEATKIIKARYPYVKIIIITVSDDIVHLFDAIKKGAQGYLLKNLDPTSWYDYIKAVAKDEAPMSKGFAMQILKEFTTKNNQEEEECPLSTREQELLQLVAKGDSNKDVAEKLNISEYTVKNHLKNIMQKLHMKNRVQLASYAYEKGLVK